MTALLVAVLVCAIGAVVYMLAPPKFDQIGWAFVLAGAFAVTAILCGVFG